MQSRRAPLGEDHGRGNVWGGALLWLLWEKTTEEATFAGALLCLPMCAVTGAVSVTQEHRVGGLSALERTSQDTPRPRVVSQHGGRTPARRHMPRDRPGQRVALVASARSQWCTWALQVWGRTLPSEDEQRDSDTQRHDVMPVCRFHLVSKWLYCILNPAHKAIFNLSSSFLPSQQISLLEKGKVRDANKYF